MFYKIFLFAFCKILVIYQQDQRKLLILMEINSQWKFLCYFSPQAQSSSLSQWLHVISKHSSVYTAFVDRLYSDMARCISPFFGVSAPCEQLYFKGFVKVKQCEFCGHKIGQTVLI
jgi:hypothetical protein